MSANWIFVYIIPMMVDEIKYLYTKKMSIFLLSA